MRRLPIRDRVLEHLAEAFAIGALAVFLLFVAGLVVVVLRDLWIGGM